MISLKILTDELKCLSKEQRRALKIQDYDEAARIQEVINTLEFVRDWHEE